MKRVEQPISLEEAKARITAFKKRAGEGPHKAALLAKIIWPDVKFVASQGAGAAASRVLKRLGYRWTCKMGYRALREWGWMLILCLSMVTGMADVPKPEIGLVVMGDMVFITVKSQVQFTVWHSCNPTAMWWWLYTSPVPHSGQTLVWLGYDNKAGLYPPYNFFRVIAVPNKTTN